MRTRALASLVAVLFVGACSSETPSAQTTTATVTSIQTTVETALTTVLSTVTNPPETVTAKAKPGKTVTVTATATPEAAPEFTERGTAVDVGGATVALFDVQIPAPIEGPEPIGAGMGWGAIEAEVCVTREAGASLSWNPWQLTAGSARYSAVNLSYNQFPKPAYPSSGELFAKGECARGWIVFEVPTDGSITEVRYATQSDGGGLSVVKWKI